MGTGRSVDTGGQRVTGDRYSPGGQHNLESLGDAGVSCRPGCSGASQRRQVARELGRVRAGKRRTRYWAPVAVTCLCCFLLFHFILGIWVVSGASMAPSLLPGDVVLGLRIGPAPARGDMVIIREPSGVEMVKRVAGTAGDTLEITPDGHVIRNGSLLSEPAAWYGGQDTRQWIDFPITLPEGTVFCLGDNRALSLDSRHRAIGPVSLDKVAGRVLFVLRLT